MPSVIANKFRVNTAEEFINSLVQTGMNVSIYATISKIDAWANGDTSPDTPVDNRQNEINVWKKMTGGSKLTAYNMALVIPRINWIANTVYASYSDSNTTPVLNTNFYVVTSDFNVYKCIDNNLGAISTVMPTYTAVDSTHTEVDGYTWKFMYNIGTADQLRFVTPYWIPVKRLGLNDGSLQWLVQTNAVDGSILWIKNINGGNNFTNASNIIVTVVGDGSGALVSPVWNANSNSISSYTMLNYGSRYHYANVYVTDLGGLGTNAVAQAVISPQGGHGSNPVEELGGSNVLIDVRLKADEGQKLTVANYYRQIALLENPIVYGSNTIYSNTAFNQTLTIQLSAGSGGYFLGEYVFQGISLANSSFSGRVCDWDGGNSIIRITETTGTPIASGLLGANSGTIKFVINTTPPDVIPYSGRMLYIDNIIPIQRNSSQTEDIKFVISY